MNGFTENAASGASEKPDRRDEPLTLETSRRMLPLVRRVVEDILQHRGRLSKLLPEQERLDRDRSTLAWPERLRRYRLREEIAEAEHDLQDTLAELEVLGLELVNPGEGRVGFPTIVNDQPAYFSWVPGEVDVAYWHFADETLRRRVPASWRKSADRAAH